jgi:chemotaxis protein methyltransferase CheR
MARNLIFTYFEQTLQVEVGERLLSALRDGGALVLGKHESLPPEVTGVEPWCSPHLRIFRKVS